MAGKTPEKRLLDIIEGKGDKPVGPLPVRMGNKFPFLGSLKTRIAYLKESLSYRRSSGRPVLQDLKLINVFLQCLIGLAIIALVIFIRFEIKGSDKAALLIGRDAQANLILEPVEINLLLHQKEDYLQKAEIRDIFQMGYVKRKEVNFEEAEVNKGTQIAELTKDLKLVGISWGDDPDAIIENPEIDKTYFVRKGYMIDEMKVSDVQKDRVILRYKGEEVEIR